MDRAEIYVEIKDKITEYLKSGHGKISAKENKEFVRGLITKYQKRDVEEVLKRTVRENFDSFDHMVRNWSILDRPLKELQGDCVVLGDFRDINAICIDFNYEANRENKREIDVQEIEGKRERKNVYFPGVFCLSKEALIHSYGGDFSLFKMPYSSKYGGYTFILPNFTLRSIYYLNSDGEVENGYTFRVLDGRNITLKKKGKEDENISPHEFYTELKDKGRSEYYTDYNKKNPTVLFSLPAEFVVEERPASITARVLSPSTDSKERNLNNYHMYIPYAFFTREPTGTLLAKIPKDFSFKVLDKDNENVGEMTVDTLKAFSEEYLRNREGQRIQELSKDFFRMIDIRRENRYGKGGK